MDTLQEFRPSVHVVPMAPDQPPTPPESPLDSPQDSASAAVALVYRSLDAIGDVARNNVRASVLRHSSPLPRLPACRESLLLDAFDQKVECSLNDGRQVSVRDTVPEEVLCLTQLVSQGSARGNCILNVSSLS